MSPRAEPVAKVSAAIAAAEQLFASGQVLGAELALRELTRSADSVPLADVLGDLGVVLTARGAMEAAEQCLLEALACDTSSVTTLRNLAELSEQTDDLVQATHWWQRLLVVAPEDTEARGRLEIALARRGRGATAVEPRSPRDGTPRSNEGKRVLLVVDFFYPSIGGAERLAEHTAVALQELGMNVEVAARALPNRHEQSHRGIPIHEIGEDRVHGIAEVVRRGGYDAILIQSDPIAWPILATLSVVDGSVQTVAVPCVNAENYELVSRDERVRTVVLERLNRAGVICVSSRGGFDQRFAAEQGFSTAYVPNATPALESRSCFTARHGLSEDVPLLLCVGNEWAVKNHAGMLEAMLEDDGDWQLAIIGNPAEHEPQVAARVLELAALDPRVKPLGGLSPEEVAAAMSESFALLLPSLAEATPMVIIEAMSCGLPWIATPSCGAVHDHAGGLIVPVSLFGDAVDFLLADEKDRDALGDAGRDHWRAAYTWDVVGPRYAALLSGQPLPNLGAAAGVLECTDAIRRRFYQSLPTRSVARRRAHAARVAVSLPRVSCIVTSAPESTPSIGPALASVLAQDYPADLLDVIVVADETDQRGPEGVASGTGDRVRLIKQSDLKDGSALAEALAAARGGLVAVCDARDRWFPDLISTQVAQFRSRDRLALAYADMQVIDAAGVRTGESLLAESGAEPAEGDVLERLVRQNPTTRSTLMFRAGTVPAPPRDVALAQDWIALHAAAHGAVAITRRPLAQFRSQSPAEHGAVAEIVRSVRAEIASCRQVLTGALADSVSGLGLARAALTLDARAQRAFEACGTVFVDVVAVNDADRDQAHKLVLAASAAADDEEALRSYSLALLKDPFNYVARAATVAIVTAASSAATA